MLDRFILLLLAGILAGFALLGVTLFSGLPATITGILAVVTPITSTIAVIAIVIFALCIIFKVVQAKLHRKC
ncbi:MULTISPECIES: hypothetical protein [unclassified Rossellomorea]|uniref:hypothetical protein n=1 Tax=unclassified Rossellomorea TaxID=2837526 RepID=UPI0026078CF9|nr:hypothetical protein [uncultured Rossellomorea sp.]